MPVTSPVLSTLATSILEELQVPPVEVLLRNIELPAQTVDAPVIVPALGDERIDTVTSSDELHPTALSPVTVYVVVTEGLADTILPVVADKPVPGVQV